jgi:predicted nucleic acid-binding protein
MNLVDSCGWLEYFADGENAEFFAIPLQDTGNLIVPSICIFEVFKKILQERDESSAFQAIVLMQQGYVVELNTMLAIQSAKLSFELKLPLADSIIFATAKLYNATIWTQDEHFKDMDNVMYVEKRK